jgi:Leucine-rich repeat (LRR) protein
MKASHRLFACLLVALAIAQLLPAPAARGADDPAAIAAIEKLKGVIDRDNTKPGKPVTEVVFLLAGDDDLAHLGGLPDLKSLHLRGQKITDKGLKEVGKLTKLEALDMAATAITDDGLAHLKDLKAMKYLTLSGSLKQKVALKGAGLAHLKGMDKLEFLGLSNSDVGDDALVHLEGLKNLKTVGLSGSKVTTAGVAKLKKAIPDIKVN